MVDAYSFEILNCTWFLENNTINYITWFDVFIYKELNWKIMKHSFTFVLK